MSAQSNPKSGSFAFEGQRFGLTTSDGANLVGERKGSGPTVLLAHCWTGARTTWDRVTSRLVNDHDVVTIDLRGHGESTTGSSAPAIGLLADDLELVIKELDLSAPVVAGHSLGGVVAVELATRPGNKAAGLVLVATTACTTAPLYVTKAAGRVAARFLGSSTADRVLGGPIGRIGTRASFGLKADSDAVDRALATLRTTQASVRQAQLEQLLEFDGRQRLSNISVPATILGGKVDIVLPGTHQKALHQGIKNSTLHRFPSRGHMLPYECPDQVSQAIKDIAARINK